LVTIWAYSGATASILLGGGGGHGFPVFFKSLEVILELTKEIRTMISPVKLRKKANLAFEQQKCFGTKMFRKIRLIPYPKSAKISHAEKPLLS
jgi:hypothetical protein